MKIYVCDACGAQSEKGINRVEIPCHHWSFNNQTGFVDNEFNRVSGRLDVVDLCNSCYNLAWAPLANTIREIRSQVQGDKDAAV